MSDALFTENWDFEIKFRTVMFWLVRVCPEEAPNMVLGFLMHPGIHRVDNFLLLCRNLIQVATRIGFERNRGISHKQVP